MLNFILLRKFLVGSRRYRSLCQPHYAHALFLYFFLNKAKVSKRAEHTKNNSFDKQELTHTVLVYYFICSLARYIAIYSSLCMAVHTCNSYTDYYFNLFTKFLRISS